PNMVVTPQSATAAAMASCTNTARSPRSDDCRGLSRASAPVHHIEPPNRPEDNIDVESITHSVIGQSLYQHKR
ncbi:hypothetical protein ACWCSH_41755, partial [Streptosporangium sp. NPDC001682]